MSPPTEASPAPGSAPVTFNADAEVNTPPPAEEKPAEQAQENQNEEKQRYQAWNHYIKLNGGLNPWLSNGPRDAGVFGPFNFGKPGDFMGWHFEGGYLTNVNSGMFQFMIGGNLGYEQITGDEQTFGSTYRLIGLGPQLEFNYDRVWDGALGGHAAFLSRIGISTLFGFYDYGGTNADGLNHNLNGFGAHLRPYVNVANVTFGEPNNQNVNLALNLNWTLSHGGADLNNGTPANHSFASGIPGFALEGRYSLVGTPEPITVTETEKLPWCPEARSDIPYLRGKVAELQQHNAQMATAIDFVRHYLETRPNNPYTEKNVQRARFLGYVAVALENHYGSLEGREGKPNGEDVAKIQAAVKAAHLNEGEKEIDAVVQATGLDKETVETAYEVAAARIKTAPPFWQAPADPEIDEEALAKAMANEPCEEVEKTRKILEEARAQLRERKGALDQQYRRAVHLAGLVLGTQEIGKVFKGTFVSVRSPHFVTGNPTDKQVEAMKSAASGKSKDNPGTVDEFVKIAKGTSGHGGAKNVFHLPEEEGKKLKAFADWLNGKGRLPGEQDNEEFLISKGILKKGATPSDEEIDKAFKEAIQKVQIAVVGHTDSVGNDENNQKLSERRAAFIKAALVFFGVDESRIKDLGAGETRPAVPECAGGSERCIATRNENRRVEFINLGDDPLGTGLDREALGDQHEDSSKVGGKDDENKKAVPPKPAPKPTAPPPKKDKVPKDDLP